VDPTHSVRHLVCVNEHDCWSAYREGIGKSGEMRWKNCSFLSPATRRRTADEKIRIADHTRRGQRNGEQVSTQSSPLVEIFLAELSTNAPVFFFFFFCAILAQAITQTRDELTRNRNRNPLVGKSCEACDSPSDSQDIRQNFWNTSVKSLTVCPQIQTL
jgi:hypothetical protein